MTPESSDARVLRIAGESRLLLAGAWLAGRFAAAWPHSVLGRALAALPASADPAIANRARALALLVLVAAASSVALSFAGTRRDGFTWVVPVAAAVAAALVLVVIPASKGPARGE